MVCVRGGGRGRSSPLKERGWVGKGAPVTDLLLNPYVGSLSTPFWGSETVGVMWAPKSAGVM